MGWASTGRQARPRLNATLEARGFVRIFRDLAILVVGVAISFVSIFVLEYIVESYINPNSLHYGTIVETYGKSTDADSIRLLGEAERVYKRQVFFQTWIYVPVTALLIGILVSMLADESSLYGLDREGIMPSTSKYFLIASVSITPLTLAYVMTSGSIFVVLVAPLISGCVASIVQINRMRNY